MFCEARQAAWRRNTPRLRKIDVSSILPYDLYAFYAVEVEVSSYPVTPAFYASSERTFNLVARQITQRFPQRILSRFQPHLHAP